MSATENKSYDENKGFNITIVREYRPCDWIIDKWLLKHAPDLALPSLNLTPNASPEP